MPREKLPPNLKKANLSAIEEQRRMSEIEKVRKNLGSKIAELALNGDALHVPNSIERLAVLQYRSEMDLPMKHPNDLCVRGES